MRDLNLVAHIENGGNDRDWMMGRLIFVFLALLAFFSLI